MGMNTQALLRISVLAKKGTKVHVSAVVEHAGLNLGRSNKSKGDFTVRLFVGGLNYNTEEEDLYTHFSTASNCTPAKVIIIRDRDTGRSKGFGFVDMQTSRSVEEVCREFNQTELDERRLTVNEARPLPERERKEDRRGQGERDRGGDRHASRHSRH